MQDVEKFLIGEAIKYIKAIEYTGGQGESPTPQPNRLRKAVKDYLTFYGESLESLPSQSAKDVEEVWE